MRRIPLSAIRDVNVVASDFNVRSFRSNVVVRWEWRPGSTFYLVWQQDRSGNRPIGRAGLADVLDGFGATGDNFLAVKASYWLPIGSSF